MLNMILTYLAEHKTIVVGATATVLEVLTLFVNFWRKNKAAKQVQLMGADVTTGNRKTKFQKLLWAANPINLFRKV